MKGVIIMCTRIVPILLQDPSALHQAISLPADPEAGAGRMRTNLLQIDTSPGTMAGKTPTRETKAELSNPLVLSRA